MNASRDGVTAPDRERLLDALQHPLRRDVLAYLKEHKTGSASEIARTLGVRVGNLSYHVRRLAALGLIEEVQRIRRRGALTRVFQITSTFRDSMATLLNEEIAVLAAVTAPDIGSSVIAALDRQALGELRPDLDEIIARVRRLGAQTAARASTSPSLPPAATVAVLFTVNSREVQPIH